MRFKGLCKRNFKELIRDPLALTLGVLFPILLIVIFGILGKNIPMDMFKINFLVPAMIIFGFSFLMMFSALSISLDKSTSLYSRLKTLPLKTTDFILGYMLPFLTMALIQILMCNVVGFCFGMTLSWGLVWVLPIYLIIAILFISFGLTIGICCSQGQISGIGTVLINVAALTSGTYMDVSMIGGSWEVICQILPFLHAVNNARQLANGIAFSFTSFMILLAYTLISVLIMIVVFYYKINGVSIKKQGPNIK